MRLEDLVTWTLVRQSFAVLRRDKQLVVFPVLSALGLIGLTVPYFWALVGGAPWERATSLRSAGAGTWAAIFAWYCLSAFIVIFFNCALAACAQIRFSGGEPTVEDGLRQAGTRAGSILMWALITSTVGIIIRMVEERTGWVGRIIMGLFGAAWGLATYLIVPVLVVEDLDVMESIRRSTQLLKKTWGEQLIVGIHFGWIMLAALIPGIVIGVAAWPLGILYMLAMAAVLSAARQVFAVALYRFAVTGEAPAGYSGDALRGCIHPR